ncbi:MAG TPA: hypothetical protein V6D19_00480 [Stenomitos sp.]
MAKYWVLYDGLIFHETNHLDKAHRLAAKENQQAKKEGKPQVAEVQLACPDSPSYRKARD